MKDVEDSQRLAQHRAAGHSAFIPVRTLLACVGGAVKNVLAIASGWRKGQVLGKIPRQR